MATYSSSVNSDQKKRTLDALERRFALAKSQQQQNDKKRTHEGEKKGNGHQMNSSSLDSLARETDASGVPSPTPYTKKGHVTFFGHTTSRGTSGFSDVEANGPAYSQICEPVHEKLLTAGTEPSSKRENTVYGILHELLQNGDSAPKYMQGSKSTKIKDWFLLDNFVPGRVASVNAHVKALQKHAKRSKRHMSMKQHKKCGSFDLPREFHKFDIFKPMHDMWKEYIMQILGKNDLAQCLISADLHGAILQVADCKIASLSGVIGIMIRETAETFGIITQDDKFRVVPKKASVFIFQADCWKITLHGDKLASREI